MKRILVAVIALLLVGCTTNSPKTAVETVLKQLKQDPTGLSEQYFTSDGITVYDNAIANFGMKINPEEDEDGYAQKMADVMNATIKDFTYTIDKVQEDKDQATVTVTFTTHPVGKAFVTALTEAFQYFFANQSGATTELMNEKLLEIVTKQFTDSKRDMVTTVDVKLVKIENEWKIVLVAQDPFFDAWLGGMYTEVKNFQLDPGLEIPTPSNP